MATSTISNLQDSKDVLILYDYQNLELEFDFSKYRQIDIIAYSAGVFYNLDNGKRNTQCIKKNSRMRKPLSSLKQP